MKNLRIALIGSRGIPANYGGFETLMEELSVRLVESGHHVTVYCRSHHTPREMTEFRGVRLVVLPTVRSKHLDTPIHTLLSCLHAARTRFDVALVVNSANACFIPLLHLARIPTALNVDGIEKRRAKWGWLGASVYAASERLATWVPTRLVTDAEIIRRHFLERYGAESTVLTYGVDPQPLPPGPTLQALNLEPRRYFLYVSRFEPENNPHRVVEAYASVAGDLPLVMVGDAPYSKRFIAELKARADERVLFPGAIYGHGYRELLSHALAYVQATEVGGTHPALVEAMGYGNCLLVNETPEHREVAGREALYFSVDEPISLTHLFRHVLSGSVDLRAMRRSASARAEARYSWERVSAGYLDLLRSLARV